MNIKDSVTTCLKKYVDFDGRATRSEYWWFYLSFLVVYIILIVVDPSQMIGGIFNLAMLVPSLTAGARRLHDTDRSGWWQLIAITIIGIPVLWYFLASKGTPGDNRFGAAPALTPIA